jgi:DNA-binding MarR family transcriptional regulator
LYRQNTVLNDFVNFLKARGRFRDIEFIDNSVHATPRIPDFPSLVFYIEETRSEQQYILEIHGNESTLMNREIQEFFQINQLNLQKIKNKLFLTSEENESLTIEVEGIGPPFESLHDQIIVLLSSKNYIITSTQKTLIFGLGETNTEVKNQRPSQFTISSQKQRKNSFTTPNISKTPVQPSPRLSQIEIKTPSHTTPVPDTIKMKISDPVIKQQTNDASKVEKTDVDRFPIKQSKEQFSEDDSLDEEEEEEDLFHPFPPQKSYSNNIAPYLKQSTSLFRRDNWEEDLPTEFEMEILERTYMRIKHRTKPEILAKDLDIPIEEAEVHLRSLISKGLLRTQVGWFIIKKSHLPFFKKTFTNIDKRRKKKKSIRISRVGEGLTPEEIATIRAIKSRPNLKAQSNLLTRPTGLKQSVLKEVLRNLVDKGILRVSYGWYILKDKFILEHKRGILLSDDDEEEFQFEMPKGLELSPAEEKVVHALLQRPHYKAQSNLLTPEVKLPKEQIKQVLRDLVEKDICKVAYGWYQLKDPNRFQST